MFSYAVSSWSRLGSWKTMPNRRRTSVDCVIGSSPSISIPPLVGVSSVVSILIVVVLPAPFGPRKAKISPASTSREMSFTADTSPYFFTRFAMRIISGLRMLPGRRDDFQQNREIFRAANNSQVNRDNRWAMAARDLLRLQDDALRLGVELAKSGRADRG